MKKVLIFILIILALLLFAATKNVDDEKHIPFSRARIGNTTLSLLVADNNEERAKGLSGRESLGENEAMLFVFPRKDDYGIWMKDMNFAIDILWLDENFKVVYLKENATPESFPESFKPDMPALFVIEANTGIISKEEIKIGDSLEIF